MFRINDGEEFDNRQLNRFKKTLSKSEDDNDNFLIRNRTIMGENVLMLQQEEQDEELFVLFGSSEYEFTDYDIKIIQSLLETARIICDSISIISDDQT
ncbi:hypothetical protein [Virgibacillus ihumii]|uniref:hypothetical protein n=1 Tax=Virgibacillus ihumii TaxID=2686091 RepID=UPI00157C9AF7|nr:hypothetical protein [Virgibacillus ihumii]